MRWAVLVLLAGCYEPGKFPACGAGCADAGNDGPGIEICVGDQLGFVTETCFVDPPAALPSMAMIDTTADCDESPTANPAFCFVAAQQILINSKIAVRGTRPLVLWSASDIVIGTTGALDVAGHRTDSMLAAGANDSECSPPADVDGAPDIRGLGSGACGGSFGTAGGTGGDGREDPDPVLSLCDPIVVNPIDRLRGGCRGGDGGLAKNGGSSGGAVYLLAHQAIVIEAGGIINASGGGAASTPTNGFDRPGGGGGGSGGMIVFDAPAVDIDGAILLAIGGGGGSGTGDAGGAQEGNPGSEADPMNVNNPFAGGSGQTVNENRGGQSVRGGAGPGGDVFSGQRGGGGGGGGGHGVIRVFPPTLIPTGTAKVIAPDFPAPPS